MKQITDLRRLLLGKMLHIREAGLEQNVITYTFFISVRAAYDITNIIF